MRIARTMYLLPVAVTALVLGACGSDNASRSAGPSTSGSAKANTFVLDEWSVTPPSKAIRAGNVTVTAQNRGSEVHELVIVRAQDVGSLPTKADGSVNEDKIPDSKKAGEIADLAAGKTAAKSLDLPAGDYVAFCNIVEDMGKNGMGSGGTGSGAGMGSGGSMGNGMHHVHYALGMSIPFTVA